MKCLAAYIARAVLLTAIIFCRLIGMDKGYNRSKFHPNRTTNKWVIKSQNIDYSSPTSDSLFQSNPTFTDWNETCARWKAWGHESLGQLDENYESLVFEFWALKVDICQCLTPNNLLTDSPIFLTNIINCKYGPNFDCLMLINRVITVLRISRPNFHRLQCKIYDMFSPGRLAPIPLTSLYICRH